MAVVLAAAVVVGILVGPPLLKQREFQRNRQAQLDFQKLDASASLSYYDEKTPLCQVEPNELAQVFPQASTALGTVQPEDARFLELPVDLHYYSQPDASGEPAATIPKGTVVTLYPQSSFFGDKPGYGLACYPDYQKGWRYGKMFVTGEKKDDEEFGNALIECPYYYIQTKELEPVATAFYDLHLEDMNLKKISKQKFIDDSLLYVDHYLFIYGYFFSPDLS